jgi:hypothetical protein
MGQSNIGLKSIGDFMKRTVFLAVALFALMAVGVYAQTEADFDVLALNTGGVRIFQYKGSATAVNIPAKIGGKPVTEIVDTLFLNNTKITSVVIPNSVTNIGENVFTGCTSLTSVTFNSTIAKNGFKANAFEGIGDIRDKYFAANGGIGTYTRPNGTSTTWTKGASAAAPAAAGTPGLAFAGGSVRKGTVANGDVVIPASYNNLPITEIPNNAFEGVGITSVIIPDSVTTIGQMAFQRCIYLKSVTIGSGVKDIGINAFNNCTSLDSVTFNGAISSGNFNGMAFNGLGDLRAKYLAGGAGTYTRSGQTWTKK